MDHPWRCTFFTTWLLLFLPHFFSFSSLSYFLPFDSLFPTNSYHVMSTECVNKNWWRNIDWQTNLNGPDTKGDVRWVLDSYHWTRCHEIPQVVHSTLCRIHWIWTIHQSIHNQWICWSCIQVWPLTGQFSLCWNPGQWKTIRIQASRKFLLSLRNVPRTTWCSSSWTHFSSIPKSRSIHFFRHEKSPLPTQGFTLWIGSSCLQHSTRTWSWNRWIYQIPQILFWWTRLWLASIGSVHANFTTNEATEILQVCVMTNMSSLIISLY